MDKIKDEYTNNNFPFDDSDPESIFHDKNKVETSENEIEGYNDIFKWNTNENENFDENERRYFLVTTSSNTESNKKIFSIIHDPSNRLNNKKKKKRNKQRGRWRKCEFKNNKKQEKNYHSKSKQDNIIHKIKVFFIESTMNFINKRFKDFEAKKGNKSAKLLSRIKSEFTNTIKKEKNLIFLNTKIKDLFSCDLSEKYINLNKNFNKTKIKELYQKNEADEVIDIMEKTVEELLQNYINGDYEEEGFYIENDLNKERKKMIMNEEEDVDNYTQNFLETAKNFGYIFRNKIARRKKGTKQMK